VRTANARHVFGVLVLPCSLRSHQKGPVRTALASEAVSRVSWLRVSWLRVSWLRVSLRSTLTSDCPHSLGSDQSACASHLIPEAYPILFKGPVLKPAAVRLLCPSSLRSYPGGPLQGQQARHGLQARCRLCSLVSVMAQKGRHFGTIAQDRTCVIAQAQ
jgi:hypothetical protein